MTEQTQGAQIPENTQANPEVKQEVTTQPEVTEDYKAKAEQLERTKLELEYKLQSRDATIESISKDYQAQLARINQGNTQITPEMKADPSFNEAEYWANPQAYTIAIANKIAEEKIGKLEAQRQQEIQQAKQANYFEKLETFTNKVSDYAVDNVIKKMATPDGKPASEQIVKAVHDMAALNFMSETGKKVFDSDQDAQYFINVLIPKASEQFGLIKPIPGSGNVDFTKDVRQSQSGYSSQSASTHGSGVSMAQLEADLKTAQDKYLANPRDNAAYREVERLNWEKNKLQK